MLPKVCETLIYQYLDELHDVMNLPNYKAVKRLVKKSNDFVLRCLGFVLDLPDSDLITVRYQISFDVNFIFYFRLSPIQRIRLITLIERGMIIDQPTCMLVWLFVLNDPRLIDYPRFRRLFVNSLLCTLLSRLRSLHSLF